MSEVLVVAVVVPQEGKEQEVEELFSSLVEPTHAEDGCLTYALHRDKRNAGQLVFVERWENQEKLGGHINADHFTAAAAKAADLLAEPIRIHILEPVPMGDPAKGRVFA